MTEPRCRSAIHISPTLATRCLLFDDEMAHEARGGHIGRARTDTPTQRIQWLPGDRREFLTDRPDVYAWEDAQ